jgi:ribose transport system ATP-binding protein
MAMVPEERRTEALFPGLWVRENLTAASLNAHGTSGVLRRSAEQRTALGLIDRLGIMARDPEQDVATLSGGNQQKVVVGRWLTRGLGCISSAGRQPASMVNARPAGTAVDNWVNGGHV